MPGGRYGDVVCVVWAGCGDDEKALDGNFTIFGEEFLGSKTKKRVKDEAEDGAFDTAGWVF